jgi:hypothetical protein
MKRRSNAADETVSLFPFLAVLLCTMGTLALIFAIASQNIAPNGESADATATKRGETSNALDVGKKTLRLTAVRRRAVPKPPTTTSTLLFTTFKTVLQ